MRLSKENTMAKHYALNLYFLTGNISYYKKNFIKQDCQIFGLKQSVKRITLPLVGVKNILWNLLTTTGVVDRLPAFFYYSLTPKCHLEPPRAIKRFAPNLTARLWRTIYFYPLGCNVLLRRCGKHSNADSTN